MSGAYVAKPADVVASTLPPGWTIGWTHPGPWPPGYIPELTYNLVTNATYAPGATHNVTGTLRDQVTYATKSPDNNINWTAAISGAPIQLKFNGEDEWSDSLSSSHSSVGDYFGAEPTFLFNVSSAQENQTIVLTAQSIPFDDQSDIEATASANIVVTITRYATVECLITSTPQPMSEPSIGDPRAWGHQLTVKDVATGAIFVLGYQSANRVNGESVIESHISTLNVWDHPAADTFEVSAALEDRVGVDELYYQGYAWFDTTYDRIPRKVLTKILDLTDADEWSVTHRFENHTNLDNSVVYDFTLKVYENGALASTTTKQVTVSSGYTDLTIWEWLRITSAGVITIIDDDTEL